MSDLFTTTYEGAPWLACRDWHNLLPFMGGMEAKFEAVGETVKHCKDVFYLVRKDEDAALVFMILIRDTNQKYLLK